MLTDLSKARDLHVTCVFVASTIIDLLKLLKSSLLDKIGPKDKCPFPYPKEN